MESKIINLGQAGASPGREILDAAANLLNAVCRQYPRLAPDMHAGVSLRVITRAGAVLEISGGAMPAPGKLIIPGGN